MSQQGQVLHNPPGSALTNTNAVVGGKSRIHDVFEFEGTLSIKAVLSGQATWSTHARRSTVDSGTFLVLNHGSRYNLNICSKEPTETFCVFFKPGFVELVRDSMIDPVWRQLEECDARPFSFDEFLSTKNPNLDRALGSLRQVTASGHLSTWQGEDAFRKIAEALILAKGDVLRQMETVPLSTAATKKEVMRRLSVACQFMLENYAGDLNLEAVASVACISPHYFHSLFRKVFGHTPHEFLTRRRLDRAKAILTTREVTVEEACLAVGFSSPSSFTKLYKRRFGATPKQVR